MGAFVLQRAALERLATANLMVQATALGLTVHAMGGFDGARAREVFRIPEDHAPVAVLAVGYPGDPETLPPQFRQWEAAPRTRKPLSAFVFGSRWGQAFPPVSGE